VWSSRVDFWHHHVAEGLRLVCLRGTFYAFNINVKAGFVVSNCWFFIIKFCNNFLASGQIKSHETSSQLLLVYFLCLDKSDAQRQPQTVKPLSTELAFFLRNGRSFAQSCKEKLACTI